MPETKESDVVLTLGCLLGGFGCLLGVILTGFGGPGRSWSALCGLIGAFPFPDGLIFAVDV